MPSTEHSTIPAIRVGEETQEPLTREALYEAVWRTPMRTLARRYGCSDRGLAKACERYRIPVPPRGFWAKLAVGQRVRRPTLPKLTAGELQALPDVELPTPSQRAPAPGTAAAAVAAETLTAGNRIQVRDTLHGAHPLVVQTREMLESAAPDDRGILHPDGRGYHTKTGALAVHVSKPQIHRALRIFDALLKAIESNGWTVRCPAKTENRGTGITLLGEEVPICIEEKVKRFDRPRVDKRVTKGHSYDMGRGPYTTISVEPYPRWGYEQLGQLALRVPSYSSPLLQIADGNTQKLDDRLDEFIVGVVKLAERQAERRRAWAEEERQREQVRQRRQDLERQRAEEAARLVRLRQDAAEWREAEVIRGFIAAAIATEINPSAERKHYFEWALAQAGALDPLVRTSDAATPPRDAEA